MGGEDVRRSYRLLIINPGSTSTKIALYDNEKPIFNDVVRHSSQEISSYKNIMDQLSFRKELILKALDDKGFNNTKLSAIVGRGGLLKPLQGGTYRVNEVMIEDLTKAERGQHASNLGGILAYSIAKQVNIPAYIVDPPVVDEVEEIAKITGLEGIEKQIFFHALNQKAIARKTAKEIGKPYEEAKLIVAHIGGGISVGVHSNGRVIDVNNALDGDGPLSPERTGSLPVGQLIDLCFSGRYTLQELKKMIVGKGGLVSYLGTNDCSKVSEMIAHGDERAELIYKAMAYQVAKEIGAAAAVLRGEVDAIAITGGVAYDVQFVNWIKAHVEFLGPVSVYPGEDEMLALAEGGLRVLRGEEEALDYGKGNR
ncbi:MAG: butyrate kinase [Clostridiales bacterium]|nr:butyrate kinase [Clostridiales bacterium]